MIRAIRDLLRLMVQRGSSRTVQLGHLELILTDARHPTPPRDMQRSKRESASAGGDEPPDMVRPRQQLVAGGVTTLRTGDGEMPADSPPEELQEELRAPCVRVVVLLSDFLSTFWGRYRMMT